MSARLEGGRRIARAIRAEQAELARTLSRLDQLAAEDVHRTRVRCRKLRSWLKTFGPHFDPDRLREYRLGLKAVADVLGDLREIDVLHDLAPLRNPTISAALNHDRTLAARKVRRRLHSVRIGAALALVQAGPAASELGLHRGVSDVEVVRSVQHACKRAARRARSRDASEEGLHELRLALKHCRYALEITSDLFPKEAAVFARRLRVAQQYLGDYRDAIMARQWLAAHGPKTGPAGVKAEQKLAVYQRTLLAQARAAVRATEPAWERWQKAVRALMA